MIDKYIITFHYLKKVMWSLKNFIKECVENDIPTIATVVVGFEDYKVDVVECEKIAKQAGANFRVRQWLKGY